LGNQVESAPWPQLGCTHRHVNVIPTFYISIEDALLETARQNDFEWRNDLPEEVGLVMERFLRSVTRNTVTVKMCSDDNIKGKSA